MTKDARGYTLIELVSVMVLIAIMAALAVPRFSNTSYENRFFSDQLMGALRFSQQLAVASGCDVQVSYNGSVVAVNLSSNNPPSNPPSITNPPYCRGAPYNREVINPITRASSFTITPPAELAFKATNLPIIFDSMGRARNSSYVVFSTPAEISVDNYTIFVVGETGYVYVAVS